MPSNVILASELFQKMTINASYFALFYFIGSPRINSKRVTDTIKSFPAKYFIIWLLWQLTFWNKWIFPVPQRKKTASHWIIISPYPAAVVAWYEEVQYSWGKSDFETYIRHTCGFNWIGYRRFDMKGETSFLFFYSIKQRRFILRAGTRARGIW